jgi:lipopolysaccharide export LptBFGC system permease protein LptF
LIFVLRGNEYIRLVSQLFVHQHHLHWYTTKRQLMSVISLPLSVCLSVSLSVSLSLYHSLPHSLTHSLLFGLTERNECERILRKRERNE